MDFIFVYLFLSWVVDKRIFIILSYERLMHYANEFFVFTHEKYWFCIFFFCLFFFLSSCPQKSQEDAFFFYFLSEIV